MAEAPNHFCTLCQEYDFSNTAVSWCSECEDFLCKECDKVHSRSKSSKQHTTINDVSSFGKISVKSLPSSMNLKTGRGNVAQISVPMQRTVNDIKLTNKCTIMLQKGVKPIVIYGCTILPDGKLLFLDNINKRLMLHSKQGEYNTDIATFSGRAVFVVYIGNNTVAVTICDKNKITFIDTEENKVVKSVTVPGNCHGIDTDGDRIMVRLPNENVVLILDLKGNVTGHVQIPGKTVASISVFNGKIYCTDWEENKVFCYTMQSELLWTFQHKQLISPGGVAVDNSGFVYVACRKPHSLMVISPDGRESKVLLDEKDGLKNPNALYINREKSVLLVSNNDNGMAFLFQI